MRAAVTIREEYFRERGEALVAGNVLLHYRELVANASSSPDKFAARDLMRGNGR